MLFPTSSPSRPRKLELQRQKEAYERQLREAERKREMEREKAEKREQAGGSRVGDRGRFQPTKDHPYAPWCWYIYLHDWEIYRVNVGIHIPAPWSIWVGASER